MDGLKSTHRRMMRLGQMLKLFLEKERVTTESLRRAFETTPRTIQRDLSFLKQCGYPISEAGQGVYRLDKSIFKNFEVFDENELAYIIALKCAVSQLGEPFRSAAEGLFNRLYQAATQSVYIHIDKPIPLDTRLMNRLLKAIRGKKWIGFHYASPNSHPATIAPYRIVHYNGFWYLIGKEEGSDIIKRYALDKLKELKVLPRSYGHVPDDLDALLEGSANIWFGGERNLEIVIEANKKAADYFRRRKIFPTQEIRHEKPDGSLVVTFKVGAYEEIRDTLKAWLPNIRILEPPGVANALRTSIEEWIVWQKNSTKAINISK